MNASMPDGHELFRQTFYQLAAVTANAEENNLLLTELLALAKNLPLDTVRNHYQKRTE